MVAINEQNAFLDGKPLFLAKNILRDYNFLPQWRTTGSFTSGADRTAPGFDTWAVFDGHAQVATKATWEAGHGVISLLFDVAPAPLGLPNELDMIVIQHANLHLLGGSTVVNLEKASDSAFSAPTLIHSWDSFTSRRLWATNFGGAFDTHSSVQYFRLRITNSANFGNGVFPQITEVWAGKRIQLGRAPNRPIEHIGLGIEADTERTMSGNSLHFVKSAGGAIFGHTWTPLDGNDGHNLNDYTSFQRLMRETNYGARGFVYIEEPIGSNRDYVRVMKCPPDFRWSFTRIGPNLLSFGLPMIEEAPFVDPEVNPTV